MSTTTFNQRLNHCLDQVDAPKNPRERANVLSKILDIPKHEAWTLLEGHHRPDDKLLENIANEFEVDTTWLAGDK